MNDLTNFVLAAHALATVAMAGVIWFVQIVHYPLMASVGEDVFKAYERRHVRRITFVVAPLMLTEATASCALLFTPVVNATPEIVWIGIGLLLVAWGSTAFLQVPCHRRLEQGYDVRILDRLIATNWIRTIAWSARAALAVWLFPIASTALARGV